MACGRWEVGCPLPPPARSALAGSVRRPQTRHGRAEGDPGMPEPGGTGRVHPGERPRVAAPRVSFTLRMRPRPEHRGSLFEHHDRHLCTRTNALDHQVS